MSSLRNVLGKAAGAPATSELVDPEEVRLFFAMRERMENGSRVEFKEDHNGELVAIESVLHRASDFAED